MITSKIIFGRDVNEVLDNIGKRVDPFDSSKISYPNIH